VPTLAVQGSLHRLHDSLVLWAQLGVRHAEGEVGGLRVLDGNLHTRVHSRGATGGGGGKWLGGGGGNGRFGEDHT
jgi:hypothetical protein